MGFFMQTQAIEDTREIKKEMDKTPVIAFEDIEDIFFERKVRERAHAYFGRFFLKVKVIPGRPGLRSLMKQFLRVLLPGKKGIMPLI